MEDEQDDVVKSLHTDGQLIVVAPDQAVEVVRRAASEGAGDEDKWDFWISLATSVRSPRGIAVVGGVAGGALIASTARDLWKARNQARIANLPYREITTSQAEKLVFPPGHHRPDVVYAVDPGVPGKYYPVASFHRLVFDSKVAEVLDLLGSLGATKISIEYLEGFDQGGGVDFSISPSASTAVEVGGEIKGTNKARSDAKIKMQLKPTMAAQIPKDLYWYWSEPYWQTVAKMRLEHGLQTFSIDLNYEDDFGVNASLKAKIAKVGLKVGGKFTEHRETVWKLSGTFGELTPSGATSAES